VDVEEPILSRAPDTRRGKGPARAERFFIKQRDRFQIRTKLYLWRKEEEKPRNEDHTRRESMGLNA